MKLYCVAVAPNPTKVMLYIAEKNAAGAGIEVEQITVKLMRGEQNSAAHRARNPFASLPVLEIAPGDYIIESLAIIEYLEEAYPQPSMLGDSLRSRAQVRELERIADLRVLLPLAQCVHATNSPLGLSPNDALAAHSRAVFSTGLLYLNQVLSDERPFLAGAAPSIADCTLSAALQFARFAALPIALDIDHVNRWNDEYCARDAARSVLLK